MIVVTGSVTASPAAFDRLRDAALAHVRRSRLEPGCISHSVQIDCEDPMRFFFFERWADRTALDVHFGVPETRTFIATIRAHAVASSGPDIYEVAGA